jgi:hypothetical protein
MESRSESERSGREACRRTVGCSPKRSGVGASTARSLSPPTGLLVEAPESVACRDWNGRHILSGLFDGTAESSGGVGGKGRFDVLDPADEPRRLWPTASAKRLCRQTVLSVAGRLPGAEEDAELDDGRR